MLSNWVLSAEKVLDSEKTGDYNVDVVMFSGTTVTKNHKLSLFKQQKLILFHF